MYVLYRYLWRRPVANGSSSRHTYNSPSSFYSHCFVISEYYVFFGSSITGVYPYDSVSTTHVSSCTTSMDEGRPTKSSCLSVSFHHPPRNVTTVVQQSYPSMVLQQSKLQATAVPQLGIERVKSIFGVTASRTGHTSRKLLAFRAFFLACLLRLSRSRKKLEAVLGMYRLRRLSVGSTRSLAACDFGSVRTSPTSQQSVTKRRSTLADFKGLDIPSLEAASI